MNRKLEAKKGEGLNVVHLGVGGGIPVPPGDKASGTERYIYNLTNALGCLGCHVDVIDIKGGAEQKEKRKRSAAKFYEVWHPPLRSSYNFSFWPRFFAYLLLMTHFLFFTVAGGLTLKRLCNRQGVDIIHLHSGPPALIAIMMNELSGHTAVTVYTFYTGYPKVKLGWRKKLPNLPEILALKWSDHVVTISPTDSRWLIPELRLSPGKVTPIFASAEVAEAKEFLSHEAGPHHQSEIVLCVGSISSRKNQLSVVKTVLTVVKECADAKFVFAGLVAEPSYFDSIKEFIAENNLSRWVEFKGEVSRDELYQLYSEAALFIFPTTAESQGIVVVEAMAFGLPVIASNIGPIADMVGLEKGSAILFDPYDIEGMATAVIHLLKDSTMRQSIAMRGEKLAERFSHQHSAEEVLALYTRLVQSKKQRTK